MPQAPDLKGTQEIFWELISAPEGVGPGARKMASEGRLPSEDLCFMIRGDERLASADRLDVYANMYFYRIRDCLAEDYPKVAAVAGGARFHNLVTDYLLAHPSSFWSLRNVGAKLQDYIREHSLSREFPFIADLARLEWARIEVFDETDSPSLTREQLTRMAARKVQEQKLRLVPALRLLELAWNIAPVWLEIEEGGATISGAGATSAAVCEAAAWASRKPAAINRPAAIPSRLRVWRREYRVLHRSVAEDEMACLKAMARSGATLPMLCEMVLGRLTTPAPGGPAAERQAAAARRMASLVDLWLDEELLLSA